MTASLNFTTVKTTCPYCGVGCGVKANPTGSYATDIAGDESHPANLGRLCVKGSALGETVDLEGRLLYPQVRGQGVSWDTALTTTARAFKRAIDQYGPDRVAFYVSGQLLTEDYYVANKLMKGYIGSANIDTNSRLCMSSAVVAHKRAFGADTVPGCYEDLELADLLVLTGSNTAWCHPVLFQRMIAARDADPRKKIVVLDPRRTATCEQADLHLPLKPGTDVLLFNGLLAFLATREALDQPFIDAYTNGFAATLAKAQAEAGDPAEVARFCDVPLDDLLTFYNWFVTTPKTVTLFSQGVNQSSSGSDKGNAIINAHLASGRIGKPGACPFSITGQPNAMGGREVGGLANLMAAHMGFDQGPLVQEFWNSPRIAKAPGFKAVELFDAMHDGYIKAVWIMATNPAVSMPNADKVNAALKKCEFVAVSDCIANTDTSRYAHVLFPATGWGEKDGTVTNSERCISRQRAFMPPAGEAKPDWWIISEVAKRMGFGSGFPYEHQAEIFCEHAALSTFENNGSRDFDIGGLAGLDRDGYDSLEPIQWPVVDMRRFQGHQRFFDDGKFFTADSKANLIPVAYRQPENRLSDEYPLILNTGRVRDHWHTMTRTAKSPKLSAHRGEPYIEVHPGDAERLGMCDGDLARLQSTWGQALARVTLSAGMRPGEVFMPMHWTDQYSAKAIAGSVVNPVVDPLSGEPEFKHTPVALHRAEMAWHGFALSHRELPTSDCAYWTRIKGDRFWRYELAGEQVFNATNIVLPAVERASEAALAEALRASELSPQRRWAEQLFGLHDPEADWIEYLDAATSTYRAAWLIGGQIEACVFLANNPVSLTERGWLASLFSQDEISVDDRRSLLLGESADPAADVGPIVCACFGVGRKVIERGICEQGLVSTEALGAALKCGTNCGSCVPELKSLIAVNQPAKAA